MKTRTLTAMVMAVTMIPLLIWGDVYFIFEGFCLIVSLGAAYEFRKMFRNEKKLPLWIDALTMVFTGLAFVAFVAAEQNPVWLPLVPTLGLLLMIVYGILMVFINDFKAQDFGNALSTILYCSIGLASLALLRGFGLPLILYGLIVAMLNDTFAMWIGMKFGKHKLCPLVSPKKSVEGAIGGFVIGGALTSVFGIVLHVFGEGFPWVWVVVISLVLSCLGQIGDLVASKFKRSYGIKDYSNLFPGHGGILDRFDSWMFVATALYLIVTRILVL